LPEGEPRGPPRAPKLDLYATLRKVAEFYQLDPDIVVGPPKPDVNRSDNAETPSSKSAQQAVC
jgi:hypothetical protein